MRMPYLHLFALCAVCAILFCWPGKILAVTGFSVGTNVLFPVYEGGFQDEGEPMVGPIIRYDINNNVVARPDTIFGKNGEIGQYPHISFDGTRVAFYRWGIRYRVVGNQRQLVAGTDTVSCYISVVNRDGTGLKNILKLPNKDGIIGHWPLGTVYGYGWDNFIAWPAGEWIYYEWPNKTGVIRKVNAQTGDDQLVAAYQGSAAGNTGTRWKPDVSACYIRRWNLSANAQWCGEQTECGGENFIGGTCFPPPGGINANCASLCPSDGCNQAVSASGLFIFSYLYEGHSDMYVDGWDHSKTGNPARAGGGGSVSISMIEQWSGKDLTNDWGNSEWIRPAANSDKWACRMISCDFNSNTMISNGTNQAVVNWVDKQAIVTTNNPCSSRRISDCGHFWVNDPTHNPDRTRYENKDGSWTVVPGATAAQGPHAIPFAVTDGIRFAASGRSVSLQLPEDRTSFVNVNDLSGRILGSYSGKGMLSMAAPGPARGLCVITIRSENGVLQKTIRFFM